MRHPKLKLGQFCCSCEPMLLMPKTNKTGPLRSWQSPRDPDDKRTCFLSLASSFSASKSPAIGRSTCRTWAHQVQNQQHKAKCYARENLLVLKAVENPLPTSSPSLTTSSTAPFVSPGILSRTLTFSRSSLARSPTTGSSCCVFQAGNGEDHQRRRHRTSKQKKSSGFCELAD